ncbi:hypothetical protein E3P92_04141 [Wallemia ichthyophaga]|nr:hypothetical protein E3P95_04144 [Wallemia ichthyophaga]TIA95077.1 hypothetical protein E3P94_04145 [Wallemia ichthyophaga]TIB07101.1 hypothetical protein E3P92_04141 [Wallemia ichthyophaga]TIB28134.1 hypothetical protein E3P84_04148 [Wallemia ichthyophaga]TIB38035.1 hypothetical protein E3P83_04146 [Wallemia ichthyophaga]
MNNFFQVTTAYRSDPSNPTLEARFNQSKSSFSDDVDGVSIDMLVLGIVMFLANYIYMHAWVYTSERTSSRIRSLYLRSVLRQDITFFDKIGAGEIATRIETDTHLIQSGISEKVANAVMFLGTFVAGFIIAFTQQPKVAGVMFIIVPVIAIAGGLMNKFTTKYSTNSLNSIADSGTLVEEVISTIRTAKAFGSQIILGELYDTFLASSRTQDELVFCVMFLTLFSTLLLRGETEVGDIVAAFMSILIGAFSLAMIAPELQAISKGQAAAAKIYETIERIPSIDSASKEGLKPESVEGNITFDHVNFVYPARPGVQVMKDFNANFHQGQMTALVGASGSGKSTSVNLVERFYDPITGVIKLDGNDLRDLNVKWLRSKIGLVGQEPVLFNNSVRANVEHGMIGTEMEGWDDERKLELVMRACKIANADDFINALPEKYHNSVGERGMLLSGGQKQRVAIARAIVSDPPILLLDEATAALDSASESIVQKALDQAAKNRTTVAIAHRLSTIKNAQQIIVMGGGEILEVGDHNTLTANPDGAYSKLVAAQSLAQSKSEEAAQTKKSNEYGVEEHGEKVLPLDHPKRKRSIASEIFEHREKTLLDEEKHYSMLSVLRRLVKLNRPGWGAYALGATGAIITGACYPIFGIIFGKTLQDYSSRTPEDPDYHSYIRSHLDRDSLWFFVIAIGAGFSIGLQSWAMQYAGELLTYALRHESFNKLLRSDVMYFDQKENSTGIVTSELASNAQKVVGLAGISMGTVIQSISCLVFGVAVGIGYSPILALVATACIPLTLAAGISRLKIVVTKDEKNKKSYAESSQRACESAGAIRTVASLTREDQALGEYEELLQYPLRNSIRTSLWSSAVYGISQGMAYLVIALIFWYGSQRLMELKIELQDFYVCLMSVVFASIQAGNVGDT